MKREYQDVMAHIQVPEGLNDRVLQAAREQQVPASRRWKSALRGAVCAACALALVVGTVRFSPVGTGEGGAAGRQEDGTARPEDWVELPVYSFGLTAYAADTEALGTPNANGGLAFRTAGEASRDGERGYFTGCLFQVTGEGIERISLTLDRGGFYRWDPDGETAAQPLGSSVTADYDSTCWYGFWVPGVDAEAWGADARAAANDSLDELDGATLSVSVTFRDGGTQRRDYLLASGMLKTVPCEDGPGSILLPQLAGDDEPGWYGLYAASETESRWLQWPVEGANTISLSNDYGCRWDPGGQSRTFHPAIDIPAETGTPILAAADGTVTETGFDAERGHYLKLDHGGGLTTMYAHCSSVEVRQGDGVNAGDRVAAVGNTGLSTGPHLHFEVRQDGAAQNPTAYFSAGTRAALRMG